MTMPGKVTFSVNTSVGVLIGLVGLLLVASYILLPLHRDEVKFIATVVGGAAALYSAYFIGESIRYTYLQDKKKASFDFISRTKEFSTTDILHFITTEVDSSSVSQKEMYKIVSSTPEMYSQINVMLSFFEDLSNAIQEEYVDERIVYPSLSFLAPWAFNKLKPYIYEERIMEGDPRLYKELQDLVAAWEHGKYVSTGGDIERGAMPNK